MDEADIQEQFQRNIRAIFEKIQRREESAISDALRLLDQTRREVITEIAQGGRDFNLSVLRQVERAITRLIEEMAGDMSRQLQQDLKASFDLGVDLVDEPLKLVGRPVIGVSREVAQVAAQFSAEMIRDLSGDLLSKVNAVLRRASLGGLGVQDAIELVGKKLTDPGPFRSIAARAETIVRTEVLRIQSIATQARMDMNKDATRRAGYGLGKEWLATPDLRVRPEHLAAMGQQRAVDEPFLVGGEKLMYPRDPKGSAQNTINCRCISIPTLTREYALDRERKFER